MPQFAMSSKCSLSWPVALLMIAFTSSVVIVSTFFDDRPNRYSELLRFLSGGMASIETSHSMNIRPVAKTFLANSLDHVSSLTRPMTNRKYCCHLVVFRIVAGD